MKKRLVLLIAILTFSATATHAFGPDNHPLFDRMDTNKDGFLTLEEIQKQFPKFTAEMFKRADTNGDGKLTVEEWQTFVKAWRAEKKGGAGSM